MESNDVLHSLDEKAKLANELLGKKYNPDDYTGINLNSPTSTTSPIAPSKISFKESELSWKLIAQERLQMLTQVRDEMQAWNEAYLKEKERGDRLEEKLFCLMNNIYGGPLVQENNSEKEDEVKHTVSSPAQVNTRRANWPRVKNELEKQHSAHDAGIQRTDVVSHIKIPEPRLEREHASEK
jgi:hypothetical protein